MTRFFIISLVFILQLPFLSEARVTLKIGDKAPDFQVEDPSGKVISFSSLRGKIVLLDFWASWCLPCRMANKEVVPIYQKFNALGFEIFSISLDSKKELWAKAIAADNLNWNTHGSDLKGWDSQIAKLYNVEALPSTFLVDENGNIVEMDLDEMELEEVLNKMLFEQINVYPKSATTKIVFTSETKYQIEDVSGKVIVKGKGAEADITGLPNGDYLVRIDKKTNRFTKIVNQESPATFYPTRVDDILTFSRKTNFEIYNQRGKLEKSGNSESVDVASLKQGLYFLCIDGEISSFFKK